MQSVIYSHFFPFSKLPSAKLTERPAINSSDDRREGRHLLSTRKQPRATPENLKQCNSYMSGALGMQPPLLFGPDSNIKHALNKKAPQNKRKKEKTVRARKPEKGRSYHTDALTPRHGIHTHPRYEFSHTRVSLCKCACVCVCTRPPLHVLRVIMKAQQTSRTSPAALLQKYTRLSRLAPHRSREECRKRATRRIPDACDLRKDKKQRSHNTEGDSQQPGGGISRKTLVAHAQEKRLRNFQRGRANASKMSNVGRPMYAI